MCRAHTIISWVLKSKRVTGRLQCHHSSKELDVVPGHQGQEVIPVVFDCCTPDWDAGTP